MNIGNVEIKGFAALAPMAGVADRAFRELCVEYGAAYVVGEMASSKGIAMNDRKSAGLLAVSPKERPAGAQIFGDEPGTMALAAVSALRYGPDVIDINMGCPAPKVAGNGGGSALMKRPELAWRIAEACVRAVNVPVTVKMRSGWDADSVNAVELAVLCEEAGVSALTVHGRTRAQMYAPPVNLDVIREVKRAVKIPVIGNGDVVDGKSAAQMLLQTGCDLVMVGRGALGRPWVFGQINAYLADGTVVPDPPIGERMDVMLRHIERLCEYKGAYIGMREARKHAAWYIKGVRNAAMYRNEIGAISSMDELRALALRVIRDQESGNRE
ncbi:MAG: tRNA dihydrouridine synthase DusB [Oscillospiraceae bacterium]|nr:tRNA dihydrouridine synthase DusB [Oscillospiraceae bacterium]